VTPGGTDVHAIDHDVVTRVTARHLGTSEVRDLTRLSGGASRETWAYDAVDADGSGLELILRRDPPGRAAAAVDECALLTEAARVGVAVPRVRFELDEDDGIGHGFVMDRIAGETLGRRIVHDDAHAGARTGFAEDCGRILAAIHGMDIERSALRPPRDPSSFVTDQVSGYEQLLDGYDVARPVLELAMRWLRTHQPTLHEPTVVHGDFRVGNLIVGDDGVRAVLDWELAHVGDPAEDLGWLCVRSWRFGGHGRVGGIGSTTDLLAGYTAAGGRNLTEDDVRYWEVFGNLRWAVICVAQAFAHLNGDHRSVELAAIGRRVSEVEHDLMELLG
jgi:aminoglycoside phosphotransferase (APT) family kinase protein